MSLKEGKWCPFGARLTKGRWNMGADGGGSGGSGTPRWVADQLNNEADQVRREKVVRAKRLGEVIKEGLDAYHANYPDSGIQLTWSANSSPANHDGQPNGYKVELGDLDDDVLIAAAMIVAAACNVHFRKGRTTTSTSGVIHYQSQFETQLVFASTTDAGFQTKVVDSLRAMERAIGMFEAARSKRAEQIEEQARGLLGI